MKDFHWNTVGKVLAFVGTIGASLVGYVAYINDSIADVHGHIDETKTIHQSDYKDILNRIIDNQGENVKNYKELSKSLSASQQSAHDDYIKLLTVIQNNYKEVIKQINK